MIRAVIDEARDLELRALKDRLLIMGGRCERMLLITGRLFIGDAKASTDDLDRHRRDVHDDERLIDETVLALMEKRLPVARDLRLTLTGLSIQRDLLWIAEELVRLGESESSIPHPAGSPEPWSRLADLNRRVATMLHRTLGALVSEEAEEARASLRQGDEIAGLAEVVRRDAIRLIDSDRGHGADGARIAAQAQRLERIAQHVGHIAERVTFLALGRTVRLVERR